MQPLVETAKKSTAYPKPTAVFRFKLVRWCIRYSPLSGNDVLRQE
jgi:hypothetical protein